jgi:hypothetical protein
MTHETSQHEIERAGTLLRGHTAGTLIVDAVPFDIKYIIDPRLGSLVLAVTIDMLASDDVVLVIPEDRFDAPIRAGLELASEIEEEACDRFVAYHLDRPYPVWARGRINFVKLDSGAVIDQSEIERPNPLVDALPGLCKRLNADRQSLGDVCTLLTHASIDDPVAVGVDPFGFDVRCRFGVLRVEFPSPVHDARQAEEVIAALYGGVS